MKNAIFMFGLISTLLLTACSVSDVRKETTLEDVDFPKENDQLKAHQILDSYIRTNGYDKFDSVQTYQVTAHEHWNGFMGYMGNPWPVSRPSYIMKFSPSLDEFTNQVLLTSDDEKGSLWGMRKNLSSTYTKKLGEKEETIGNGLMAFNLANYQWWIEFPYRISKDKNVAYAGEKERNGKKYDLVLATWGNDLKPSKEYDQYMMWFNKSTGLLEIVTFTYRSFPRPMPPFMYGTALFSDFRRVNGINLPFSHKFQINGPSDEEDYAHHFVIEKTNFNIFDKSELVNSK